MPTGRTSLKTRAQRSSNAGPRRGRAGEHRPRRSRGGAKAPSRRTGGGRGHPGGNRT